MNKKQKQLAVLIVATVVVLGFVGEIFKLEVLSVDRIWLHQRGVGEAGEELTGGWWRVTATSQSTSIQFLKLTEGVMQENQEYTGDFPDDVEVKAEILIDVGQPYNPYWVIPVTDLGTVEVVPPMQSVTKNGPTGSTIADSVSVHLWSLNLAQKEVIIPFRVLAAKTKGENTASLVTDDPRGEEFSSQYGKYYDFSISQSDIVDGETGIITFYNPLDPNETFKINLLWAFGDYDKYSWNENFLFVTPDVTDFTPSRDVTFLAANEQAIKNQLNWQSGSDWTFMRYWYGGGNTFKGTTVYNTIHGYMHTSSNIKESSLKSTALIATPVGDEILAEGYISGSNDPTDIYEYAGWFTPSPNAGELVGNSPSEWHKYRYPLTPNIFAPTASTPMGLGIVGYLSSEVKAPVTGYTHSAFPRRTPNVWGYGCGGNIGVNGKLGVVLPNAAREWLFTLDVSTELADTVVIKEDYIDVEITQQLAFDSYTLSAEETATGSVTLRNNSPFDGVASVGITSPSILQYTTEISGGDGSLYFASGETKTVDFTIKNTGLLEEEKSGTFTFKVVNQEPRTTATQTFSMTFKPGIGVPDTLLSVTTKDADSGDKVSGIALTAVYGGHSRSTTTVAGEAVLDLGKYEGPVTVSAVDYQGRYEGVETVVQVASGSNPLTLRLIPKGAGSGGDDWAMVALVLGIASMATLLLFYYMRRKRRR